MYGKAVIFIVSIATVSARIANMILETEMPPSCVGKSYCFEKSRNYPQERIDNIFKTLDLPVVEGNSSGMSIGQRTNGNQDTVCERINHFQPIFEIVDNNDIVRYVVQSDRFRQMIRTESCAKPGRITDPNFPYIFERSILNEFNFSCIEKRIDYSFLALSLDGNSLEDVEVQGGIPVCCSCRISY